MRSSGLGTIPSVRSRSASGFRARRTGRYAAVDPEGAPSDPGVAVFGSVPLSGPWLTEHNLAWSLHRRTSVVWVDPPRSPVSALRGGRPGRVATAQTPL